MLKIVYPNCCGMDVHKNFLVACIATTNSSGVTTYKSKRFSTYTGSLIACREWLKENNCKDVCMESTGKYWALRKNFFRFSYVVKMLKLEKKSMSAALVFYSI